MYSAVLTVDQTLTRIENYLEKIGLTNNVIVGNGNKITGEDNIVTGDGNILKGNDNWIISRNGYQGTGAKENYLVYKNWVIDLNRVHHIKTDPHSVIKNPSHIHGSSMRPSFRTLMLCSAFQVFIEG
jgi:hypothetical protein